LTEFAPVHGSLLQQPIILNSLCGYIHQRPDVFNRKSRVESNFTHLCTRQLTTSLRNKTSYLAMTKNYKDLCNFFKKYFPELITHVKEQNSNPTPYVSKRRKPCRTMTTVHFTKHVIEQELANDLSSGGIKPSHFSLFESYCCSILDFGKLVIQNLEVNGIFVCCLNDYSDIDGSFRHSNFVYTTKIAQENGDNFYCSCSIYRTLINMPELNIDDEYFVVLDSARRRKLCDMYSL